MSKMSPEKKEEIIRLLNERGVSLPCPRCNNSSFTLIDGYFNQNLQDDFNTLNLGGPSVPSVVTACSRCGFISQHALGALGLLIDNENKEDKKNE